VISWAEHLCFKLGVGRITENHNSALGGEEIQMNEIMRAKSYIENNKHTIIIIILSNACFLERRKVPNSQQER
jgi:hypothetical protein